ncbi:MAG TPA: AAA family ATPase [Streptosporangiaceae bacterium]|nr:AAA family ATPase [Streptosporangiaceae bacterium]
MLHVSLLGEQGITEDRTSIQVRSSRAVALIAFLAVHAGTSQSRQRIAGTFWPESADGQALTNLRRELHHLRQILGDEPSLVVTSRDLCWGDTDTCRVDLRIFASARAAALAAADDAGVLAHAATAVECYKGDLLPGIYDLWVLDARSELDRQCADLCDLLGAARARAGDLPGAARVARRRIQLQPLEEIGYRSLMLLQADQGDLAGAVSTYHHCASVLERELGVIPGPVTRQAFRQLIASGAPDGPTRPAVQSPSRPGVAVAQLVGRSRELARLAQLWRNAAAGRPGLVMIRGGAGVGKSRIAGEIASMAGLHGAVVASSQCFGTSGRLALAPVADWLRHPAVLAASAAIDPVWQAELGRLLPAGGRGERGAGTRAMVDSWQGHRFFEGLARALMAVGRPTLLVLDNMQWCDQETLSFITFLLGLAADTPVLVIGTWRDDAFDDDSELAAWTVRMRATGLLTEVSLSPLDVAGTARLAEAIFGRPLPQPDADLLAATTGGFPLYIVEAMRGRDAAGRTPLPDGDLAAVLRNRLEQASAPAREVAGLAAAVGEDFTLDLLTEACDLDAGTVVEAVDELWRHRIVREYRDGYDFSHDLLRETAYTLVSPPKRWLLHRRVAQALELLHPGDADAVSAQLAGQYARGGQLTRAVAYYRRAADVAAARFAHAEAIRLHSEALAIVRSLPAGRDRDRQELDVLEAIAAPLNARYGYSSPRLQQALERSVVLAEALGRKDATLTGLVGLWMTQFVQGRAVEGYQTAKRALALADPDSEQSGPAHFAVGGSAVTLGRPAEALRHLGLAVRLTSGSPSLRTGTRADVHGEAFAAHAHWLRGQDDDARASCRGSIGLARTAGHPYSLAVALAYAGITHQLRGDLPRLRDTVTELRELCERHGFAYYREWALVLDGWARPGASGLDLAQAGIGHLKSAGSFARMPYWLSLLADLWERDDRPDAALATLDAALAAGRAYDDLWWLPEVMRMRAARDDAADQAAARLTAAARLAAAQGSVALLRRCERDLAAVPSAGVRPAGVRPAG